MSLDRQVTPLKKDTSPTWGPPPLCKQALSSIIKIEIWKQHMHVVNKDSRGPISLGGYSILVQILWPLSVTSF